MPGSIQPLGEILRTFRFRAGLSQEALSEAAGVSVRTISDLERGQRASAHLETVRLLASALDLTSAERRQLLESARPDGLATGTQVTATPHIAFGAVRWNASIPAPATSLVGRARELDALMTSIEARTGGLFTLTGPGGVGKTRLAIEIAHRLAPSFADGAAFVELATVTQAELVPDTIARMLGATSGAISGAEQLTVLLTSRELLLVLDNLEQVVEAAPFIADLDAACPHLTVLVTSRVPLRVSSEREICVPPLSLAGPKASIDQFQASDAIQLFAERARRVDPQFEVSEQNVAMVSEICRRLDGLPLAIELAASRLRILPVPVLLERLDRRLPLLTGGDRDLPARQQSMRDTIAWSYELLHPTVKQFLRWMSVFSGGLSLDSAEALGETLGLDQVGSLEAVTSLVESGLAARSGVADGRPRFLLFETIREFGQEQLVEAGELDAAQVFHAEHFLGLASMDAPRPDKSASLAWVDRLSREHPNLLTAFDYLCTPATAAQGLQFAAALGPFWHARGPVSEGRQRLCRALDIASPAPTLLKADVLYWASIFLGSSGDLPEALLAASRYIDTANQVGTPVDQAAAIEAMAWVQECHEQWETARELREQAMAFWASVGNTDEYAICLALNAGASYALGDLDRAQREIEQAGAIFQTIGNLDWRAASEWYQGIFAVANGRLDLGAEHYEQCLRTWLQSESSSRWYRPLVGLADVAAAIGLFTTAARLLGAADDMLIVGGRELMPFDRPGYARAETRCRGALGDAVFETHRKDGTQMSPDDWLRNAGMIVSLAQLSPLAEA